MHPGREVAGRASRPGHALTMHRSTGILMAAWLLAAQPCALAAEVSFHPAVGGMGRFNASVDSELERRWRAVVRQGLDISCGSAALATIINYQFGEAISENTLIQAILQHVNQDEVRKRGGFSLLDLKRVGSSLGYTVKGYRLSLEQLTHLGTALVPITVRGFKHFVVFRGLVEDRVVVADPAFGNLEIEQSNFGRMWQGIAMTLAKGASTDNGSQLGVAPDTLQVTETHDALRTFMTRPAYETAVRADEL